MQLSQNAPYTSTVYQKINAIKSDKLDLKNLVYDVIAVIKLQPMWPYVRIYFLSFFKQNLETSITLIVTDACTLLTSYL